jgi:hypothetical protein
MVNRTSTLVASHWSLVNYISAAKQTIANLEAELQPIQFSCRGSNFPHLASAQRDHMERHDLSQKSRVAQSEFCASNTDTTFTFVGWQVEGLNS